MLGIGRSIAAVTLVFALGAVVRAADVPIVGLKLIVVDKLAAAGKAKAIFVSKDGAITKGSGTDPAQISAVLDVRFDSVSGAFDMAQGEKWLVNSATVAKYVDKSAPAGGAVKVSVVKPAKLVKVVGKSLGDVPLDLSSAPAGPVYVADTIVNGGEEIRLCTQFGACAHQSIAKGTGYKLVCKGGSVGDPACTAVNGPNTTGCIYVSTSLGTPGGSGTAADPIDTIGNGIQAALDQNLSSVCVSGETYAEQVVMASGVDVLGGYDHTLVGFPFKPSATTTVVAPGTVFLADGIDQETAISNVTVQALTPATPGGSTYGVRVLGGTGELVVHEATIEAEQGAGGSVGVDATPHVVPQAPAGANGTNGVSGGSGGGSGGPQGVCVEYGGKGGNGGYDSGTGQDGSPGSGNATVGLGAASDGCFGGGNMGGMGGSVGDGAQGSAGGGGVALGMIAGGSYVAADGGKGATGQNGKGGSGGGGGGGGRADCCCNADRGGGGGAGGCGGLGGDFGRGGGGGGGSFGVFAAGGSVSILDSDIATAGGGDGGAGGNGAAGQLGGAGGTGGSGPDDAGNGGGGGPGSNAGAGGPGGGGGGGPSACVAHAAAVTIGSTNVSCALGVAGLGGAGGTNPQGGVGAPGSPGTAASELQIN